MTEKKPTVTVRILDSDISVHHCFRCGREVGPGDPQVIYGDGEGDYEVYHKQCDLDDTLEREAALKRWQDRGWGEIATGEELN